eukprot:450514_1
MGNCILSESEAESRLIDRHLLQEQRQKSKQYNLLFFGPPKTGKSTLFNQLRIILGTGFSEQCRLDIKPIIYKYLIDSMRTIIQIIEISHYENENNLPLDDFVEEHGDKIYDFNTHNIHNSDEKTLKEIMNCIQILCQQKAVKQILKELNSNFFFNELSRICDVENYIPSDADIVHIWYQTEKGIRDQVLTARNGSKVVVMDINYNTTCNYNKFLHCFQSITALIFVVSLSCFDEIAFEVKGTTEIEKLKWKQSIKLLEDITHRDIAKLIMEYIGEYEMTKQMQLFRKICCDPYLKSKSFIVLFNKNDLFTNKIESMDDEKSNAFVQHFYDYTGDIYDANECGQYIQSLFQNIFDEYCYEYKMKHNQKRRSQFRRMYSHFVDATDSSLVQKLFYNVQHVIINDALRRGGLCTTEKFENGNWVVCTDY